MFKDYSGNGGQPSPGGIKNTGLTNFTTMQLTNVRKGVSLQQVPDQSQED
jgi:hypothetical protein